MHEQHTIPAPNHPMTSTPAQFLQGSLVAPYPVLTGPPMQWVGGCLQRDKTLRDETLNNQCGIALRDPGCLGYPVVADLRQPGFIFRGVLRTPQALIHTFLSMGECILRALDPTNS